MNSGRVLQGNAAERHLASAACVKNLLIKRAPSWREVLAGNAKESTATNVQYQEMTVACPVHCANFLGLKECGNAFYSPSGGSGSGRNTVSLYLSSQHF